MSGAISYMHTRSRARAGAPCIAGLAAPGPMAARACAGGISSTFRMTVSNRYRPAAPGARDRARGSGPRGGQAEPRRGRGDRARGRGAGGGVARTLRRRARRGQRDRGVRAGRPRGGDAVRVAGALLPRGQDAARAPRRSCRPGSAAWSSAPTTPPRRPPGAASGILRDEGVEVVLADGELATRARLLNQAFRKHARTGRPWVLFKSAMTLDGKVATRAGDSQWISGEECRALAHRWRASVDAVVVGIGTALADDPQLTARPDGAPACRSESAPAGRVRLARSAALRLAPARRRRGDPADGDRLARRRARGHRRAGGRRRAGAARDRRERARARALGPRPARSSSASPRLSWRAAPISPERSSTPARSTRSASSWRPLLFGGRTARDPLEGEGVERISDALHALSFDCERVGEDLLVSARECASGEHPRVSSRL